MGWTRIDGRRSCARRTADTRRTPQVAGLPDVYFNFFLWGVREAETLTLDREGGLEVRGLLFFTDAGRCSKSTICSEETSQRRWGDEQPTHG